MTPNWVHMQPPVFVPIYDPAQGAIVLSQVHDPGVIPAARSIAAVGGHPVYVQNHHVPPGMFAAPGGPGSTPIYDHEYWPQPLPQPRLRPRVPRHKMQPRVSQPRVPQPRSSQPRVSQPRVSQTGVSRPRVSQPRSSQPRVSSRVPQGQLASSLFFLRESAFCVTLTSSASSSVAWAATELQA